jgi:hypothetical protein
MPTINIRAGEGKNVQTSGRYLSIINANGNFVLESPKFGSLVGEVGRQYDFEHVASVVFSNNSDIDLTIEYEAANIRVSSTGKGNVSVINELVIKTIKEQIRVKAQADNPAHIITPPIVTIESGQMAKLVDKDTARYELLIQNISGASTVARIGDINVSPVRGLILTGSRQAAGTMSLNGGGEIWAFNDSDTLMTLSIMEVLQ